LAAPVPAPKAEIVMPGVIRLPVPGSREVWVVPVLYRDDELLVLDKPGLFLSTADPHIPERPHLLSLLRQGIAAQSAWAREYALDYLAVPHRLDYEASGVFVLARSPSSLRALGDQYGSGRSILTYQVLVQGTPPESHFEVQAPLAPHRSKPGHVSIQHRRGKKATTVFQVLERFRGYTWLEARPAVDRPSQVRVHLQSRRLPVVGDTAYGGKPLLLSRLKPNYRLKPNRTERPLMARAALHACQATFRHPSSGEVVTIQSELAKDLRVSLKYLRQFAVTS